MFQRWPVNPRHVLRLEHKPLPETSIYGQPSKKFVIQSYPEDRWMNVLKAFHFAQHVNQWPNFAKIYGIIWDQHHRQYSLILARPDETLEDFLLKPKKKEIVEQLVEIAKQLRGLNILHRGISARQIGIFYDEKRDDVLVQLGPFEYGCYQQSGGTLPLSLPSHAGLPYESDFLLYHQCEKKTKKGDKRAWYDGSVDQFALGMCIYRVMRGNFYTSEKLPIEYRLRLHRVLRDTERQQCNEPWFALLQEGLAPYSLKDKMPDQDDDQEDQDDQEDHPDEHTKNLIDPINNKLDEKAHDMYHYARAKELGDRCDSDDLDECDDVPRLLLGVTSSDFKMTSTDAPSARVTFACLPCLYLPCESKTIADQVHEKLPHGRHLYLEDDPQVLRLLVFLALNTRGRYSCQNVIADYQQLMSYDNKKQKKLAKDLEVKKHLTDDSDIRLILPRYPEALCKIFTFGIQRQYDSVHQWKTASLISN